MLTVILRLLSGSEPQHVILLCSSTTLILSFDILSTSLTYCPMSITKYARIQGQDHSVEI